MKENLKTFPCTMAKLCQKPPVVFEIDTEKNRDTEHKLPMRYRIEDTAILINHKSVLLKSDRGFRFEGL